MSKDNFERALEFVLFEEGGFSNHKNDPGGPTMMGITQKTLSEWRGNKVGTNEVQSLTREEAKEIYRVYYWDKVAGDLLPSGLDLALFDYAVNSGPAHAIRQLQKALGVSVDGVIGPETLGAAQSSSEKSIDEIMRLRRAFLESLENFPVFGKGWMRRIDRIGSASLMLAAVPDMSRLPQEISSDSKSFSIFSEDKKENGMTKVAFQLDLSKNLLSSRTLWANAIGMVALVLSWFGFDTGIIDKSVFTDNLLQGISALGFVASSIFRVLATRRLT